MKITEKAKLQLETIFEKNEGEGIRFYSMGAGCCGPQLGLSLDAPKEDDNIQEVNGIRVAIDKEIKNDLDGLTLDNDETSNGPQFVLLGMKSCC
ncbi:UNVERIFIED_CONTAM: adhesin [Halobacillus marinus]|uniref:HesB/IscA family protein n=1 Tax=Bacillaceae TaxID=186817 RepID=UPI0002A4EF47|nr:MULTISPECIES: HesB/YadR/YfhF-family protein [Bacillaceae]ELK48479.1 HesB/YadR/YfhF-family protein [Halobacillus sp. BAB-2008]QHT47860.1 adhesin [Bacillus sp. SB49]